MFLFTEHMFVYIEKLEDSTKTPRISEFSMIARFKTNSNCISQVEKVLEICYTIRCI